MGNLANVTIILYELLRKKEEDNLASGRDQPEVVLQRIRNELGTAPTVTIDLSNMRSLSPSFAYEAFGKLVDEFGDSITSRLVFTNDPLNLKTRAFDAIKRRQQVLKPRASTG